MAQVKKEEIRRAILESAFDLFTREGYVATSLPMIAKGAGISSPNVYSYFPSKLAILYAIFGPWIRERFAELEARLTRMDAPAERLRALFGFLWQELPGLHGGFANNVIQAISTATPRDQYRTDLIAWMETRIGELARSALPASRHPLFDGTEMTHLIVMTLDGYIMYHHTQPSRPCSAETIEAFCRMLEGDGPLPPSSPPSPPQRARQGMAARVAPRKKAVRVR